MKEYLKKRIKTLQQNYIKKVNKKLKSVAYGRLLEVQEALMVLQGGSSEFTRQ